MKANRLTVFPAVALLALGLPFVSWNGDRPVDELDSSTSAEASYAIDGSHSWVLFRTMHVNIGAAYGTFAKISGSVEYDAEDVSKSSVEFVIDADSINTNSEGRDKHLKSQDFFSVKQYPEIRFVSSKVAGTADAFEVTGTLSLHGVDKEITASVKKLGEGEFRGQRVGFEAEFSIDRTDFGMNYMPDGLGPEVDVVVAIEAIQK